MDCSTCIIALKKQERIGGSLQRTEGTLLRVAPQIRRFFEEGF